MTTKVIDKGVLTEPEINYWYPHGWEGEYRRTGKVQCWLDEYPHLFDGSRGTLKLSPDGTLANFSTYGLMYLLMRDEGVESLTYFRLCAIRKSTDGRREALQKHLRTCMGDEPFERLRNELLAAGVSNFKGEPDLFCWNPENRAWFFAEAKWKDNLTETQRRWFSVCKRTISDVTIKVCRLRPLPAGPTQ
jgi:VRR-NUC domain-containing protein